jgi:hypothetical protein
VKPLPADPLAFQARIIGAFCDDLFDMAAGKSSSCERTNALRQVSITSHRDGGGNASCGNPPPSNS